MHNLNFLTSLHRRLVPRLYLEIGVGRGASLRLAQCPAIGVDPAPKLEEEPRADTILVRCKSDAFFASGAVEAALGSRTIDLAFIDGWHNADVALRDFVNIERYCDRGGAIVLSAIRPTKPEAAVRKPHGRAWTGDVWKVADVLERYRPDLALTYVDNSRTGLLVVQGLDPENCALQDAYEQIERELTASDAPLMPPRSFHDRFVPVNLALKKIVARRSKVVPAADHELDPRRDIANIVAVRFSIRMSEEWLRKAYGTEAQRGNWLAMRARLFRETLYRSLKAQTVPPRKVLLIMDEGDRAAWEAHLAFDPEFVAPVFITGRDHALPLADAVSRIAVQNVALSRIDSDDMVATGYLEAVNATIARAERLAHPFDFVVAPRGYRSDGKQLQRLYFSASPFLTRFAKRYTGQAVYGFNHVDVLQRPHVVARRAHWMQCLHDTNVANRFQSSRHTRERFDALTVTTYGRSRLLASSPEAADRSWPDDIPRFTPHSASCSDAVTNADGTILDEAPCPDRI
jgi:predicted O-methyltransferase YrrM